MKQVAGVVLETYYGHQPLAGERLAEASEVLRRQLGAFRAIPGVDPELLFQLSQLDGQIAARLGDAGRHEEARAVGLERLDVIRELKSRGALATRHPQAEADAFDEFAALELDAGRPREALGHLRRAAELRPAPCEESPQSWWQPVQIADHYRKAEAAFAALGDDPNAARARDGLAAVLAPLAASRPVRPAQALLKAAALAELGRPDEAQGLIDGLAAAKGPFPRPRRLVDLEALDRGVRAWFRLASLRLCEEVDGTGAEAEAERLARLLVRFFEKSGGEALIWKGGVEAFLEGSGRRGTEHRRAGRVDRADRAAAGLSAFALALLRERPEDATAIALLGDASNQECKNAWARDDLATVRRKLGASVATFRRALEADPEAECVRARLRTSLDRLAKLPPP